MQRDPTPAWMTAAACRGRGQDMYVDDDIGIARARRICDGCPVQRECLQHATARGEQHGVWGGQYFGHKRRNPL